MVATVQLLIKRRRNETPSNKEFDETFEAGESSWRTKRQGAGSQFRTEETKVIVASATPMKVGEQFRVRSNGTSTFYVVAKEVEAPVIVHIGRWSRLSDRLPVFDEIAQTKLYEVHPEE